MDILDHIRNDIAQLRSTVPLLGTEETIQAVERIRRLESLVADVVTERQRSAILAGRPASALVAVVVSGPVVRPAWQPPVRAETPAMPAMPRLRGLSVVSPEDESSTTAPNGAPVSRWVAQRTRCFAALVALYGALVVSREASLDY